MYTPRTALQLVGSWYNIFLIMFFVSNMIAELQKNDNLVQICLQMSQLDRQWSSYFLKVFFNDLQSF